jgi:hypothetical protein
MCCEVRLDVLGGAFGCVVRCVSSVRTEKVLTYVGLLAQ